jgi:cytochrome c553
VKQTGVVKMKFNLKQYRRMIPVTVAFVAMAGSALALAADLNGAKEKAEQVCSACHGKDGNSPVDPSYPRLAGQHQDYLRRALLDYHSDARKNAIMGAQAKALTKKEIGDLAAYYASLPGQLVVRK